MELKNFSYEPRYASLPNIMKAKKKPIEQINASDLGVDTNPRIEHIKIKELQSELNLQNLQVWSNFPGIDHDACMRSIRLFNDEVIPKINPDKSNIQKAS